MTNSTKSETPLVIWTLQRTGGTNFANNLRVASSLPVLHEPFNRPREFGEISTAWEAEKDRGQLELQIAEKLKTPMIIKHCVEMVPWRVNAELADQATIAGYKHIFLFRESSLQRLLSMEYARRTKVWGPAHEKPDEQSDPAFEKPLDVDALVQHEHMSSSRLEVFWKRLVSTQGKPIAVSFEQLYASEIDVAREHIQKICALLGLDEESSAFQNLLSMRDRGDQKTRDRYARFSGLEELKNELEKIPPLSFA